MPAPSAAENGHIFWVRRVWLVVFVLFCLEVGIILIALPWTRIWAENSLLLGHPRLRELLDAALRARTDQRARPGGYLDGSRRSGTLPGRSGRVTCISLHQLGDAVCIQPASPGKSRWNETATPWLTRKTNTSSQSPPLAYENSKFLNGPDGRVLRILAEYLEPLSRFRRERIQDTIVFFGSARFHSRSQAEEALQLLDKPGSAKPLRRRSRRVSAAPKPTWRWPGITKMPASWLS